MALKAHQCKECGGGMSQFFKGNYCSDACRQAKARRKRNAGKTFIRIKKDIRALIKLADDDALDYWDMARDFNEINEMVRKMYEALEARYQRQMNEETRRASSD